MRSGKARAAARERAWQAGAAPAAGPLIIDIDATLITTHTEKDGTAGTFKGGWGFAPLLAFLDGTREPLAAKLRPGNAPAHTAADHVEVLDLALAQIPEAERAARPVLVRCDSGGQTHAFTAFCAQAGLTFAVTLNHYPALAEAIAAVADRVWTPAVDDDGARENGHVVEVTDALDLSAWPEGSRVIVRRERPHPGAQLRFTDEDVDQARAAGVLIEFDGPGRPMIVVRPLYREPVKAAIKRTHHELLAKAEAAKDKQTARNTKVASHPVTVAKRERDAQLRELTDQAHGANLDLGHALVHQLASVDPADLTVARFFVLCGPPHRSAYVESRFMPRMRFDRGGAAKADRDRSA